MRLFQDLANYLTGKSSTSEYITIVVPELPSAPEGMEAAGAAKRQRLDESGAAVAMPPPDLDAAAAAAHEVAMEGMEDAENAALRAVFAHEVQLRDRNSMLSIPGRSFKRVEEMVKQYMHRASKEEEQRRRAAAKERARGSGTRPAAPPPPPGAAPVIPIKPSGRYDRQTATDATTRDIGADKLGVKVGFAAAQDGTAEQVPLPPHAPPPPAGQQPRAAAAQQQRQQQAGTRPQQRRPSASAAAARPPARSAAASAPKRSGTPIIMVPPALTAMASAERALLLPPHCPVCCATLCCRCKGETSCAYLGAAGRPSFAPTILPAQVNMFNAQSFLEQGVFKTVDKCKVIV